MKTVLLLARAERLTPLFSELANTLSKNHKVIITLGLHRQPIDLGKVNLAPNNQNIFPYMLADEIQNRYAEFRASGKSIPNLIANIENELGLTVYAAASNYLSYRRFAYQYYGTFPRPYDQESEYIEEFIGSYLFFKEIFDRYQPDVSFCETPDQISHRIASAMAHSQNVFSTGIFLNSSLEKGRALLTSGTNRRSVLLDHYYSNPKLLTAENIAAATKVLSTYQDSGIIEEEYIGQLRSTSSTHLIKRVLAKSPRLISRKKNRSSSITKQIELVRNLNWLNKVFKRQTPKDPYILFCLHHQPEASTSLVSPHWIDQDMIIEQLALKAPYGLKIVVKENPRTYGLRGKQYFEFLTKFPNVHLLHPEYNQSAAIRKATAVLAISGTVGLESILMRKKVGVLSSCFYSSYKGVRKLNHPDELFEHLRDPSWKPEETEGDLLSFTAAALQASFYLGNQQKLHWPPPDEAGSNLAKGISNFLNSVEGGKLSPSNFEIHC